MKTFLQLVNDVVYESKITLDPLTSANFAAPPRTSMYERIKRWVNQSYMELLQEKPEWFFTSERVVVTIQPRVSLTGLDHSTTLGTLLAGDIITGQESGVVFTINSLNATVEPGDLVGYRTTANITYSTSSSQNDLILNEKFSMKRGVAAPVVDYGRIGGRGRYDFRDAVSTLDIVIQGSVSIQPSVDDATNPSPTDLRSVYPVQWLPWDRWLESYDQFASSAGRPIVMSQAPDGTFEFYPRPDQRYDVAFTYSQKGVEMVLFSDTPVLVPEKFQDYIMWRAIGEVADFNKDQNLYSRAKKKWDRYFFWMMRDFMPKPSLDLTRFDLYPYGDYNYNG